MSALAGRGDSDSIFGKIDPSKTVRKLYINRAILTNLEQLVGGRGYCEAVWNAEIEAMESMDCIVFYRSLKDAGGALIVLDSSFHPFFCSVSAVFHKV